MKHHPCSKECLKYPICRLKRTVVCNDLREYYLSLLETIYQNNPVTQINDEEHGKMWKKLNSKLPNLSKIPPTSDKDIYVSIKSHNNLTRYPPSSIEDKHHV